MNKKAEIGSIGFSIVIGISLFIVAMAVVNLLTPEITNARAATALDCTNSSISDGTKLTCLAVDWAIPGYFLAIFAAFGGMVITRLLTKRRKTWEK